MEYSPKLVRVRFFFDFSFSVQKKIFHSFTSLWPFFYGKKFPMTVAYSIPIHLFILSTHLPAPFSRGMYFLGARYDGRKCNGDRFIHTEGARSILEILPHARLQIQFIEKGDRGKIRFYSENGIWLCVYFKRFIKNKNKKNQIYAWKLKIQKSKKNVSSWRYIQTICKNNISKKVTNRSKRTCQI